MDKTPLDDLLNQAFLDSDFDKTENQQLLNTVSESVLGEAKIALYKPSIFHRISGLLSNKVIILLVAIATITTAWLGLIANEDMESSLYLPRESIYLTAIPEEMDEVQTLSHIDRLDSKSFKLLKRPKNNFIKPVSAELLFPKINYEIPYIKIDSSIAEEEEYRFPVLTAEQASANQKRKGIMLKSLLKLEKDKYAEINVSKQIKNKQGYVMQNFYMRTSEVTNIEYKTFLFDILLKYRKADFLIAKPKQDEWLSLGSSQTEAMKDLYFSHPAYDDYPVVNVSRAGVEMYCQWLSGLVAKSMRNKKKIETIRLPYSFEWTYAAEGGNEKNQYPWGGPYVRNSAGCFLANYHPVKDQANADGGLFTVTAETYNPNDFGLYNMSGNVAEMVTYYQEDTLIGTKGGGFNNAAHFIQINSPDPNKGVKEPKPYIGFRPIVMCKDRLNRLVGVLGDNRNLHIAHREEQFKANEKRVIDFWDRHQNYALIDGGEFQLNDNQQYVKPFFIQKTEVTNANFTEFIEFLEEQTKTVLSQKFAPDGTQWGIKAFNRHYFTHPAYQRYPVVNISREAAIAYCNWLEVIMNAIEQGYAEQNETKAIQVKVSLPSHIEWIAAAGDMGKYNDYPWHSTLRNNGKKYEGQLMANFKYDSKEESNELDKDKPNVTAPVYSYWPNTLGIYNIGGNAAEMVNYEDGSIGAKGGSWNKPAKFMLIHAEDPFKGISEPNKEIGFRPIIRIVQ